jgi:DNA-binding phage protein
MTPQEAIQKLRDRDWSINDIAEHVGMHRSNVYLAYHGKATPRWDASVAILKLANSSRRAPAIKRARGKV